MSVESFGLRVPSYDQYSFISERALRVAHVPYALVEFSLSSTRSTRPPFREIQQSIAGQDVIKKSGEGLEFQLACRRSDQLIFVDEIKYST